jgi:multidrug efflux pump subunit AcrB
MVGSAEGDISGRGSHEALIYVGMVDQTERERSELDVEEYIRAEFLPGFTEREQAKAEISRISGFGGSGPQSAPIQYLLRGPDFAALEQYSNALAEELGQQTGVSRPTPPSARGAPSCAWRSTVRGRPSWASPWPPSPTRCASWWVAPT